MNSSNTEDDRKKHLNWCKERALECLNSGSPTEAVGSMLSDLGKHPGTAPLVQIGSMMLRTLKTDKDAHNFITGFN